MPLQEALEQVGHAVVWDGASAAGPTEQSAAADLVVLDAESEGCIEASEAWRSHDPPPGVLMVGGSQAAQERATQARCVYVSNNAEASALEAQVQSVLLLRYAGRMSGPYARAVLDLGPATTPAEDAARIIAGARSVDLALVRECLRWHAYEYVCVGSMIPTLRENRALSIPEIEVLKFLDGTQTVQNLVSAHSGDGIMRGRFLWALLSSGVASCTTGPPDERTVRRKTIASARRHLIARHKRLAKGTHYDVLEVPRDANAQRVDYAARTLAIRYSPDRLRRVDLGELASMIESNWQQILMARQVLIDGHTRTRYDQAMEANRAKLTSPWAFEVVDSRAAEEYFRRGQAAMVAGEPFKAVSAIAGACRNHSDHPDYEVSLCWAQFRAEVARGGERDELISKHRKVAEAHVVGRRPWPRALVALALLCSADDDADSARYHLQEALSVDPNLPAAKQMLGRLSH